MDKVSEYIKAARLAKGVTIEEVSEATLLSPSIIKDIEEGNFDKFSGDELYVKMYIRKIARFLEIDDSIADDYYIKTREFKVSEMKKTEEKTEETSTTAFVDTMSESLKNMQGPTVKKKSKKVYEDHYIKRYIKYAIIGILIVAIIAVIGYSFIFTRSDDTGFDNNDSGNVEGEVVQNEPEETTPEQPVDEEDEEPVSTEITFTKNAAGDFSFALPEGYEEETFRLRIDFTFATTVNMYYNNDTNRYTTDTFNDRVYASRLGNISASQALEPDSDCDTVELEFNVEEFQNLQIDYSWNLGHRYYINDQQIPLEDEDHYGTSSNGNVRTFKLTMVK